jgi:hypothetical protein
VVSPEFFLRNLPAESKGLRVLARGRSEFFIEIERVTVSIYRRNGRKVAPRGHFGSPRCYEAIFAMTSYFNRADFLNAVLPPVYSGSVMVKGARTPLLA